MMFCILLITTIKLQSTACVFHDSFLAKISERTLSEDGKLNFTQLASKYGHNAEQHEVITEDGYILTMFHIPGDKSPVLLTHGLGSSGDTWVIRGHGTLGIALADAGYDVWIANNRGNLFGRRHNRLNPDTDKKFWDFSFHEMGYYDLSAIIDHVRHETGEDKILSIGHSQGATQHLVLMSLKPEYNEKIKLLIAMSPGAYFFNMRLLFQTIADLGPVLLGILGSLGREELLRDRGALIYLTRLVCGKGIVSYVVCVKGILFPLLGYNPEGFEPEFLPTFLGHAPCGVSRKSLAHYDQLYLRKKFSQFDYGRIKNLAKYGSANPPDYNLTKVTLKVAILSGELDRMSPVKNGKLLQKNLPNAVFEVIASTTHVDFIQGKKAYKYLFPSIFKLLRKYDV